MPSGFSNPHFGHLMDSPDELWRAAKQQNSQSEKMVNTMESMVIASTPW
jgi:hypothetical protein